MAWSHVLQSCKYIMVVFALLGRATLLSDLGEGWLTGISLVAGTWLLLNISADFLSVSLTRFLLTWVQQQGTGWRMLPALVLAGGYRHLLSCVQTVNWQRFTGRDSGFNLSNPELS